MDQIDQIQSDLSVCSVLSVLSDFSDLPFLLVLLVLSVFASALQQFNHFVILPFNHSLLKLEPKNVDHLKMLTSYNF